MSVKKRHFNKLFIEKSKTALIFILIITAVLLAQETAIFEELAEGYSRADSSLEQSLVGIATAPIEGARPSVIVVRSADTARAVGMHSVAKYDSASVDALYDRTASIMGEALSTAERWTESSETAWRRAISSAGIMYEYHAEIPLPLVASWLGADLKNERVVQRLCLVFGEQSVLYVQGESGYYKANTVSLSGETVLSGDFPDSLIYQFEYDDASPAPYFIMLSGARYPTLVPTNPLERPANLAAMLTSLGFDGTQRPGYTESDGTQVYVSGVYTVSVSTDGVLTYKRASTAESDSRALELVEAVELASNAACRSISAICGDARIWFAGIEQVGNRQTVTFDYFFAGGRVFFPNVEHAVTVTIVDGIITEMTICARSFTAEGEARLLPEKQALAAAEGEIRLAYKDSGTPFWYSVEVSG